MFCFSSVSFVYMICVYNMVYTTFFKIKRKLYILLGSALPPPSNKFWLHPWFNLYYILTFMENSKNKPVQGAWLSTVTARS